MKKYIKFIEETCLIIYLNKFLYLTNVKILLLFVCFVENKLIYLRRQVYLNDKLFDIFIISPYIFKLHHQ